MRTRAPRGNHIGQKFHRLTVLSERRKPEDQNRVWYTVQCDCGTIKEIRWFECVKGHTRSCGCWDRESHPGRTQKHGIVKHKAEYNAWCHMMHRCYNPKDLVFKNYGARGITVCERWKNSVAAFYEDMGTRPAGHTLDRIDNEGDYEPSNCRWATWRMQRNNKQDTVRLSSGEMAKEFCERLGIRYGNFRSYKHQSGFTADETADYYMAKLGMLA